MVCIPDHTADEGLKGKDQNLNLRMLRVPKVVKSLLYSKQQSKYDNCSKSFQKNKEACDLITKPPNEGGMGVRRRNVWPTSFLFLSFNCMGLGENKHQYLPLSSLQVFLVGVRFCT